MVIRITKGIMERLLKSIPSGPLQDFIMDAYVRFNCSSYVQMGQVEVALLDETSKPVVRLSLNDVYWEAEETFGVAKIAYPGHPAEQMMIHTRYVSLDVE